MNLEEFIKIVTNKKEIKKRYSFLIENNITNLACIASQANPKIFNAIKTCSYFWDSIATTSTFFLRDTKSENEKYYNSFINSSIVLSVFHKQLFNIAKYTTVNLSGGFKIAIQGSPGTGKTSIINCLLNTHFFDAIEINSTESLHKALYASNINSKLLIIEDIDLLSKERSVDRESTLKLFKLLDKAKHVIITSNHLDALDPALLRKGRINKIFTVNKFNSKEETNILIKYTIARYIVDKCSPTVSPIEIFKIIEDDIVQFFYDKLTLDKRSPCEIVNSVKSIISEIKLDYGFYDFIDISNFEDLQSKKIMTKTNWKTKINNAINTVNSGLITIIEEIKDKNGNSSAFGCVNYPTDSEFDESNIYTDPDIDYFLKKTKTYKK